MSSVQLRPPTYSSDESSGCLTLEFAKSEAGLSLLVDVRLPPAQHLRDGASLPALIAWHGGALFVGSRRDLMMDHSIEAAVLKSGCLLILPDYRKLEPCSCFANLEDVAALVRFISSSTFNNALPNGITLDVSRIALAGFSAGGYLARLTAIEMLRARAEGRSELVPTGIVTYFGMGGDFLLDYWITKKLSAEPKPDHLINGTTVEELGSCPYTPGLEGFENTPVRASWCKWWWDSGTVLDLHTDRPGFSAKLRSIPYKEREAAVRGLPEADLFPQLFLSDSPLAQDWPPQLLIHGSGDPIVPYAESVRTVEQLEKLGVPVTLFTVPNGDHDLADVDTGKAIPARLDAFAATIDFLLDCLGTDLASA